MIEKIIEVYKKLDIKNFEIYLIDSLLSICEIGKINELNNKESKFIDIVTLHLPEYIANNLKSNTQNEIKNNLTSNFYDYELFSKICYDLLNTSDNAISDHSYEDILIELKKYKDKINI